MSNLSVLAFPAYAQRSVQQPSRLCNDPENPEPTGYIQPRKQLEKKSTDPPETVAQSHQKTGAGTGPGCRALDRRDGASTLGDL